jgi:LCP family protein required for cell wall assembly
MIDDREREAAPGAPRSRSDPPSVPTRITVPEAGDPARRGAIVPTMVPLARKRAHRTGLRPGGAAAITEPMRDLVAAAARSEAGPSRGPSRASLGPPQTASRVPVPAPPAAPPAPPVPSSAIPAAPPTPAPERPEAPEDREPTERLAQPVREAPEDPGTTGAAPTVVPPGRPAARSVVVPASGEADLEWAAPAAATSARLSGVGDRTRTAWRTLRRRWTWRVTARLLAVAMSAVVVLVSGLAWGATSWFQTAVRQIAALDPTSSSIIDPAAQAGDQNFLVVGSDTRVGAAPTEDVGDSSDVPGARSDTVMIVHVPVDRAGMTVVSFPRDLEIDRPACERWDSVSGAYTPQTIDPAQHVKLNSAYQVGGPRCVTKVVQQLSGLAMNHFLAVDFSGFKDMVDAVAGVPICVDKPMRDSILGTVIPRGGTSVLTGDQALNFVRARHVVGDPTSDYGRIHRQQLFLSALLRQSLSAGTLLDLGKLQALVGAVGRSTYGENIEADQLLSLGQSLSGLDAHRVTFTTVPTTGVANDRGNEVLRAADDRALFDAIIDDRPMPGQPGSAPPAPPAPPVPADRVALRLVDARSDTAGDADSGADTTASGFHRDRTTSTPSETAVAGALRGYGFTVSADSGTSGESRTAIRFTPDQAPAAATLQRAVPGAVLTPQLSGTGGLVLALGDDFDGRVLDPAAPPPAAPAPALVSAADSACA